MVFSTGFPPYSKQRSPNKNGSKSVLPPRLKGGTYVPRHSGYGGILLVEQLAMKPSYSTTKGLLELQVAHPPDQTRRQQALFKVIIRALPVQRKENPRLQITLQRAPVNDYQKLFVLSHYHLGSQVGSASSVPKAYLQQVVRPRSVALNLLHKLRTTRDNLHLLKRTFYNAGRHCWAPLSLYGYIIGG